MKFIHSDGGRSQYYKKSKCGDCAIRALAIGTNTDYKQVWEELCDWSKSTGYYMNEAPVWKQYLTQRGFAEHKLSKPYKPIHRLSVNDAIVYCRVGYSTHLTVLKNGNLWDTWDCSDRLAYSYWLK